MAKKKSVLPEITEEGSIYTVFGVNTEFLGALEFERPLQINGAFQGEINSNSILLISETGIVKGNIKAASVIIGGQIIGNIYATTRVEILSTGKVNGNIKTPKLQIAEGVIFDGNCEMLYPDED